MSSRRIYGHRNTPQSGWKLILPVSSPAESISDSILDGCFHRSSRITRDAHSQPPNPRGVSVGPRRYNAPFLTRLFTPRPKQINPYGKRTRTTDRERDVRFRTAACSKHEYPKTDGTSRFTNRIGEQPGPIRIRSSGVKDARMCRPTRGRRRGCWFGFVFCTRVPNG